MLRHTRLKEIRSQRGLSQEELAERAGISQNHLSQIECGKRQPSMAVAEALVIALNIPISDILGVDLPLDPPAPRQRRRSRDGGAKAA